MFAPEKEVQGVVDVSQRNYDCIIFSLFISYFLSYFSVFHYFQNKNYIFLNIVNVNMPKRAQQFRNNSLQILKFFSSLATLPVSCCRPSGTGPLRTQPLPLAPAVAYSPFSASAMAAFCVRYGTASL